MTAGKLTNAIRRIAERATKDDERAILALLELCERQHRCCDTSLVFFEFEHGHFKLTKDLRSVTAAGRDAGLAP